VQVDSVKPMLKPPGAKHFKLKCDILLSTVAFDSNLRRYMTAVQEFRLHEPGKTEREEMKRRVAADIAHDGDHLPENRWPFASLRAKVSPTAGAYTSSQFSSS